MYEQTLVYPTRLFFGRLMPVLSATFAPSRAHPNSLYDALVVWRPIESQVRYGAVSYILHLGESTIEYKVLNATHLHILSLDFTHDFN